MAHSPHEAVIQEKSLAPRQDWLNLGEGGFGRVYKARHNDWGFDVAVKILKADASHAMFREARFMDVASCEFVVRVYGLYESPSGDRGLVTEYMKRGSIQSLQKKLPGPPPGALAVRLAHQTALAMNYLHLKEIVHLDLKPNNVLLNDELNVRLADFGLSAVSQSVALNSRGSDGGGQGTCKYMPPEAFELSYRPRRSFDVYSFGILLWSIFAGREPYSVEKYSLVKLGVCDGQRPNCTDLLSLQVDGIKDLVGIMRNCWDENPDKRPHFKDIHKRTERFLRGEKDTQQAVSEVREMLDSPNQTQKPLVKHQEAKQEDVVDHRVVVEVQQVSSRVDSGKTLSRTDKVKFVNRHRAVLIQKVSRALAIAEDLGDMVHAETYSSIRVKEKPSDRVRVLYDETLRSGGDKVKEAFYDALEKHHRALVQELEN